jgi:hypothetical protein
MPGCHLAAGTTVVLGKRYVWCQPAPGRAPEGDGDSPENAHLLWKLIFTGQATSDHDALIWIVTKDEEWALSAFKVSEWGMMACLIPYVEAKKLRTQNSPPRWVLQPAIPPGRLALPDLPDKSSGYFRIFNPWASGYLGEEAPWSADAWRGRKYVVHIPVMGVACGVAGGVVPAHDETRFVDHDTYLRTSVRAEVATLLSSVFDPTTGKVKSKEEQAQQSSYKCRTWLIQDRSHVKKPKQFPQLENTYIEKWISDHRAKLKVVGAH